jgi:hypothetical protein
VGSVTFAHDILGVVVYGDSLDGSDFLKGATLHSDGFLRKLDKGDIFSITGNTLEISPLATAGGIDQIRVVTANAPEPGQVQLLASAALAGAVFGLRFLRLRRCRAALAAGHSEREPGTI